MLFNFWLANHNDMGKRSLEDVIGIMGHQLRALGHEAIWDSNKDVFVLKPDGYNVVVEGFTPSVINALTRGYDAGARFICLATEEPTERGFNHGTQREMIYRQNTFPNAAPYLDGILHLVPGNHVTQWYGQFAPSAYAELGYAPTLVRPNVYPEPDYEYGFFGSLTPRRERLLRRLSKRIGKPKAVRVTADFATQGDRDREMSRAKVILQLRKFETMGLVSSSRCCTALFLGRPVLAEPHDLSHEWEGIVRFSSSVESFLDEALFVRGAWRNIYASQFNNFKRVMTPMRCVGTPLQKIGILGTDLQRVA